jgi:hypothetical protein
VLSLPRLVEARIATRAGDSHGGEADHPDCHSQNHRGNHHDDNDASIGEPPIRRCSIA